MITPEKVEELRRAATPAGECAYCQAHRGDMENTLLDLWKIARAARAWTKAPAGPRSTERESELVDALELIKGT